MRRCDTQAAIDAGGVWALTAEKWWGYWIRPLDGALIHAETGKVRKPRTPKGRSCQVHSARGTSATVASLVRQALGTSDAEVPDPVTFLPIDP